MKETPLQVALALCLYDYNVDPMLKVADLMDRTEPNDRPRVDTLVKLFSRNRTLTALPIPLAEAYVKAALDRYGDEALRRIDEYSCPALKRVAP